MTNEQLAILLQSYSGQLDRIIEDLILDLAESDLNREIETRYEWQGEGEEPERSLISGFLRGLSSDYKAVHTPTGDPVALQPLKNFRDNLQDAISKLES